MRKVDYVLNATDPNTYEFATPEELFSKVSGYENQRALHLYRKDLALGKGKESPWKKRLVAIIPQAKRMDVTCPTHTAKDMVETGLIFIDDDENDIPVATRYQNFLTRLAEAGIADCPHIAFKSASEKMHLLVPKLDMSLSVPENHELWKRLLNGSGIAMDPATKNPNRLMFCTGESLIGGDISLLFADKIPQVAYDNVSDDDNDDGNDDGNDDDNNNLSAIAESIVIQLAGTLAVPQGQRNNTLYECCRQLVYVEGATLENITEAMEDLDFLGLSPAEAQACIKSAVGHDKTWLHTLPPELKIALAEVNVDDDVDDNDNDDEQVPEPELIAMFTRHLPANTRAAAESVVFATLGSYLKNSVTIRDVSNKPHMLQFTVCICGNSSCGKGFVDVICDHALARRRRQDAESWLALDAWAEEKKLISKSDAQPLKPLVPLYVLCGNMTEPALNERLKCLENVSGRGIIVVPEIDLLRKMQSSGTKLGGGQDLILSAFDSSMTGSIRVSSDAVSTYTRMSVNIVASTTFVGALDFFQKGIERGTVGRVDFAIVPDSQEVPRYEDFSPETQAEIERKIDLLEAAHGEIVVPEIDELIEEIRLSYSDPSSPLSFQSNCEYFKLSHRALLIVKQKAIILYITNNYIWREDWRDWLTKNFYRMMQSKISIFSTEIQSWAKRQKSCISHQKINGPQSELVDMPSPFTLDDLVAYKRAHAPATTSDQDIATKAKDLIRVWSKRGKIQTNEDGSYAKL